MELMEQFSLQRIDSDRFGDVSSAYNKILDLLREEGKQSGTSNWKSFIPAWKDAELFDFSAVADSVDASTGIFTPVHTIGENIHIIDFNRYEYILDMPFSKCFIKISPSDYIFLQEESAGVYSGSYIAVKEFSKYSVFILLTIPFSIISWTAADPDERDEATTYLGVPARSLAMKGIQPDNILSDLSAILLKIQSIFKDMNKFCYAKDDNPSFKKRFIKCSKSNKVLLQPRPMYIVLGENSQATRARLQKEFPTYKLMHSFPVRGHWRRLSDARKYGKDRQGNYNQPGFTWVKECIKGTGELVRRARVVLPGGSSSEV